jgi:hypothetical protein
MEDVITVGKRLLPVEQIVPGQAIRSDEQSRVQAREELQGAGRIAQSRYGPHGSESAGVCKGSGLSHADRRQCRRQSGHCLQRRKLFTFGKLQADEALPDAHQMARPGGQRAKQVAAHEAGGGSGLGIAPDRCRHFHRKEASQTAGTGAQVAQLRRPQASHRLTLGWPETLPERTRQGFFMRSFRREVLPGDDSTSILRGRSSIPRTSKCR